MIKISAIPADQKDGFDLMECFSDSALMLIAGVCDGIKQNSISQVGWPTNEFFYRQIIPAFYLYRHALELGIKTLIKECTGKDIKGHDLTILWRRISNFKDKKLQFYIKQSHVIIDTAFLVLDKYHILKDEELFRYFQHNTGKKLLDLPPIQSDDIDAVAKAVDLIREAVLNVIHIKKGFEL